jgi:hypothetical protein
MVRLVGMCLRGQDSFPTIPQHHAAVLVSVEILALDVARLEKAQAYPFAALISDPSAIFRRLPFQSVKIA